MDTKRTVLLAVCLDPFVHNVSFLLPPTSFTTTSSQNELVCTRSETPRDGGPEHAPEPPLLTDASFTPPQAATRKAHSPPPRRSVDHKSGASTSRWTRTYWPTSMSTGPPSRIPTSPKGTMADVSTLRGPQQPQERHAKRRAPSQTRQHGSNMAATTPHDSPSTPSCCAAHVLLQMGNST